MKNEFSFDRAVMELTLIKRTNFERLFARDF
jgi:hypothetical protein